MDRLSLYLRPKNIWKVHKCFKQTISALPFERKIKTPVMNQKSKIAVPVYGGRYLVTMLVGGGIGPELMKHLQDVFFHAKIPVDFEYVPVNSVDDLNDAIVSIKRNGTAIKSNIETKVGNQADGSTNVMLRQSLDLYMNVIHCKPYCGLKNAKYSEADVVLIRQNTEGEYAMLEHESAKGVVESLKIMTKSNSERVAKRAFEFAVTHDRKKVTVVHKANILKLSDGLFLEEVEAVSKDFPKIKLENMLIDNCSMQVVKNLKQFDVLVMPNLYGSIIMNIVCGILGGPGLFAGCNFGETYAVFEPATRAMGIDIAGKNIANPISMLDAAVEMLYYLGLNTDAEKLNKAIFNTLCKDKIHTPDLGGTKRTTDVIETLKDNISLIQLEYVSAGL